MLLYSVCILHLFLIICMNTYINRFMTLLLLLLFSPFMNYFITGFWLFAIEFQNLANTTTLGMVMGRDQFSLCSVYVMYIYLISLTGRQLALTQLKHNQCIRQSIFLPQCPIHLASNIFLISSVYISKSFSNCAADRSMLEIFHCKKQ